MADEIDEYEPVKDASQEAKDVFKMVVRLEMDNLHRENPPLGDNVINIVKEVIK